MEAFSAVYAAELLWLWASAGRGACSVIPSSRPPSSGCGAWSTSTTSSAPSTSASGSKPLALNVVGVLGLRGTAVTNVELLSIVGSSVVFDFR
eukprot:300873-Rhodomonas_salina.2